MVSQSGRRINAATEIVLALLIMAVLADQARFLFVYPVPDTGMWFGDETWTMLAVRALVRTGVARLPEALGSSLVHSNGLINGSIWLSGLVYGIPAAIFSHVTSPVAIGRIITFLLSLIVLFFVYRCSRRLDASPVASLVGVFALVISNVFYFSSHSARLDMVTGLAVLLYFFLLIIVFKRFETGALREWWAFVLPFLAALSLTVYVHVPALLALPMIYSLWRLGAFRAWQTSVFAIAGLLSGVILLGSIYWLTTGSLDLLGKGYNQYYNVANSLPVLHLFSWRVQRINTLDRAVQMWEVAWPIVIILVLGSGIRMWKRSSFHRIERFFFINAVLLFFGWMLFGGPAVFYNIHVMPVAAVCCVALIAPVFQRKPSRSAGWSVVLIILIVAVVTIASQERRGDVGKRLVMENKSAIHTLIEPIASQANPPLILADEPAENQVAGNSNVRLMTNHLLLFGEANKPLPDILREEHAHYLLLYSNAHWRSPFRRIADSLYTFIGERVGTLTDLARTYDEPHWNEFDTLRLYQAK